MKHDDIDYTALIRVGRVYSYALPLIGVSLIFIVAAVTLPLDGTPEGLLIALSVLSGTFTVGYFVYLWLSGQEAIQEFASVNGFTPMSEVEMADRIPPCLMNAGDNPKQANGYDIPHKGHEYSLFDHSFTRGSDKYKQRFTFSVLTFTTKKAFPHIYLDGHQNGNLGTYSASQKIELEGDFNESFSLYVPNGEQINALSIISPDVMLALMDGGRPYDIEIHGTMVHIVSWGSSYGQNRLPGLLTFADNLQDELAHRNVSWQPIKGIAKTKVLRYGMSRFEAFRLVVIITAIFAAALYLTALVTEP
jgi:hypothetical protein